jgi:hypothetical protein
MKPSRRASAMACRIRSIRAREVRRSCMVLLIVVTGRKGFIFEFRPDGSAHDTLCFMTDMEKLKANCSHSRAVPQPYGD